MGGGGPPTAQEDFGESGSNVRSGDVSRHSPPFGFRNGPSEMLIFLPHRNYSITPTLYEHDDQARFDPR